MFERIWNESFISLVSESRVQRPMANFSEKLLNFHNFADIFNTITINEATKVIYYFSIMVTLVLCIGIYVIDLLLLCMHWFSLNSP